MKKNIYALLICTSIASLCSGMNFEHEMLDLEYNERLGVQYNERLERQYNEMLDQQEHQRDVLALEYALRKEKGLKHDQNLTPEQKKELSNRAKKLIKKATTLND